MNNEQKIKRLQQALVRKEKEESKFAEKAKEAEAKYPHLKPGSVRRPTEEEFIRLGGKNVVGVCVCEMCSAETVRASQDFFHATLCKTCRKASKSKRSKVVREEDKLSPAEIKAQLAELQKAVAKPAKKKAS